MKVKINCGGPLLGKGSMDGGLVELWKALVHNLGKFNVCDSQSQGAGRVAKPIVLTNSCFSAIMVILIFPNGGVK